MKRLLRENSLTLAMTLFFVMALGGQILSGMAVFNEDQEQHGEAQLSLADYLGTGHFGEAVFENWESEFLQMGLFVLLTVGLRQKGSPESKPLSGDEDIDRKPDPKRPGAPWPVRVGGIVGALYAHSLGFALLALFAVSFALHVVTGAAETTSEQAAHGEPRVSAAEYLVSPKLWFESFQNWQSEFMSVGALVVLSIFLREKGSPESKPVDAPHSQTGE